MVVRPTPVYYFKSGKEEWRFQVNPKNHYYDKFYIINYLELGKRWLDVLAEDPAGRGYIHGIKHTVAVIIFLEKYSKESGIR